MLLSAAELGSAEAAYLLGEMAILNQPPCFQPYLSEPKKFQRYFQLAADGGHPEVRVYEWLFVCVCVCARSDLERADRSGPVRGVNVCMYARARACVCVCARV